MSTQRRDNSFQQKNEPQSIEAFANQPIQSTNIKFNYHRRPKSAARIYSAKHSGLDSINNHSRRKSIRENSFSGRMKFFNSLYSGGFNQNISSNTLRNENISYSFPQAPRFSVFTIAQLLQDTPKSSSRSRKRKSQQHQICDNYYNIPSTLKQNYSSFGIGEKKASFIQLNQECPSPNYYSIKRIYDNDDKQTISKNSGRILKYCSFGIPFKYYSNVVAVEANQSAKNSRSQSVNRQHSPGPGCYNLKSSLKQRKISIGYKTQQSSFLSTMEKTAKDIPPPASYDPSYYIVEDSKFKNIGFGIGIRMAPLLKLSNPKHQPKMCLNILNTTANQTPGPGQYKIPSSFDKFKGLEKLKKSLARQYEKMIRPRSKSNIRNNEENYSSLARSTIRKRSSQLKQESMSTKRQTNSKVNSMYYQ